LFTVGALITPCRHDTSLALWQGLARGRLARRRESSAPPPSAWGRLQGPPPVLIDKHKRRHGASNVVRLLGAPAIQVNKCGPWSRDLPAFFPAQVSKFDGQSEIADGNGTIVTQLADEEAAIVGDITLDPDRKTRQLSVQATRYGRWIAPVPMGFKMFW